MNLEDIISGWNGCVCSDGGSAGDCVLSTVSVTFTTIGSPGASEGTYALVNGEEIVPIYELMNNPMDVFDIILVNGEAQGEFYTIEPVTTYSGAITLGTPEQDGDLYITPFTITGECAVTLVGSPSN